MKRLLILLTLYVLVCSPCASFGAAHALDNDLYKGSRAEFQRAYAIAVSGGTGSADSEDLQRYPLYPYLEAARLRSSIAQVTAPDMDAKALDTETARFLSSHGNEPVTRDLRRDWLGNLALRKEWPTFLENFREDVGDTSLQCYALTARIELQRTAKLDSAVVPVWLSAKDSPPACDPVFSWLRTQSKLTPELVEQRARLALTGGNTSLAKQLIGELPETRAAPLRQWAALIQQPQLALDAILVAGPDQPVEAAALLDGWTRLARQNPDAAIVRYEQLIQVLRGGDETPYALALALSLAWNRRSEALDYFDRVNGISTDERALEWYARSALWAGDWNRVSVVIASMPATLKNQARWRYWAARAAGQEHQEAEARSRYQQLMSEDNYYAVLAAARLGERYAPHVQKLSFDSTQLRQLAEQPAMVRAHELLLCNLRPLATAEWLYGYGLLAPGLQAQTVALASQWGWHDQAITTATRQSAFNDYELLYPRPFDQETKSAAQLATLPKEIIYAVLRQESLYRVDAVSQAGAYGLLQLRPETAKRMAKRIRKPLKNTAELFDPAINISLGAAELRGLLDQFDGQLPVALAAYNAGPAAASRWLPSGPIDADVWIENIPYNETRGYVQRVLWHNTVFSWLDGREARRNVAWLTSIKRTSESG